ncbi:MAG: transcription-repair coupling factor, partial [Deltaproteobacteria bacterium]|nr:transcription-repair coupling factor [Deltaproteobacteria bacterium]
IIESGLDLPSANTIIINRADTFGLAQLYQIRGRVGRSQFRAFAYLLLPKEGSVTEEAKKRLEIIQRFIELGSGFSVASHDLEIRGGGDILGPEQSGNVAAVGLDLYTELLEEAVREIEGKPTPIETLDPEIKVPFPAYLSDEYVPDIHQRLALYRRLSSAADADEVEKLEEELKDRFGALPEEAQNLLWIIYLKVLLKYMGIAVLVVGKERVSLTPAKQNIINPKKIISLLSQRPSKYQMTPGASKLVMKASFAALKDLYFSLEGLFKEIT